MKPRTSEEFTGHEMNVLLKYCDDNVLIELAKENPAFLLSHYNKWENRTKIVCYYKRFFDIKFTKRFKKYLSKSYNICNDKIKKEIEQFKLLIDWITCFSNIVIFIPKSTIIDIIKFIIEFQNSDDKNISKVIYPSFIKSFLSSLDNYISIEIFTSEELELFNDINHNISHCLTNYLASKKLKFKWLVFNNWMNKNTILENKAISSTSNRYYSKYINYRLTNKLLFTDSKTLLTFLNELDCIYYNVTKLYYQHLYLGLKGNPVLNLKIKFITKDDLITRFEILENNFTVTEKQSISITSETIEHFNIKNTIRRLNKPEEIKEEFILNLGTHLNSNNIITPWALCSSYDETIITFYNTFKQYVCKELDIPELNIELEYLNNQLSATLHFKKNNRFMKRIIIGTNMLELYNNFDMLKEQISTFK